MFCENCGKEVEDNAKFCVNCGSPVKMPKINLGKEEETVTETSQYQQSNQYQQTEQTQQSGQMGEQPQQPPKKKGKALLIILIILLVLLIPAVIIGIIALVCLLLFGTSLFALIGAVFMGAKTQSVPNHQIMPVPVEIREESQDNIYGIPDYYFEDEVETEDEDSKETGWDDDWTTGENGDYSSDIAYEIPQIDPGVEWEAEMEEEIPEFILPESDSRYLDESDFYGLTKEDCRIARNEIFARHGRRFKDEELQAYFDSCEWYFGYIEPDDFDDSCLNDYEQKNRDAIVQYEKKMGYRD